MRSSYPFGKLGQLALLLYLGSLLFSWPVGAIFGARLDEYAGASLFLQRLEGRLFDPLFLGDFLTNADPLAGVTPLLFPLVCGYFLFQVFFAGGAMHSLAERRAPFWAAFWQGFMKFGSRFLLLNLGFLPVAAAVVLLIVSLLQLVGRLAPEPTGDMVPIYLGLVQGLVVFLAVGLLQSMHYVIRAQWVVRPLPLRQLLLVPLVRNARFLLGAAGRYLGITLLSFGLAAVITRLALAAGGQGLFMLVLLQLAVFCTVAGRVWLYAAFVNHCRRQPLAERGAQEHATEHAPSTRDESVMIPPDTEDSPSPSAAGEEADAPVQDEGAAQPGEELAGEERPPGNSG
jgi:hypothetical protein